jgi:hypothetical protein
MLVHSVKGLATIAMILLWSTVLGAASFDDVSIPATRRVSETATLWLVFLGLTLIVVGGFRRHK